MLKKNERILIVALDEFEAKQAVEIAGRNDNFIITALSLEAEFYIKNSIESWKNPLYGLRTLDGVTSINNYYFPNFRLAYSWYNDEIFEYIADRLGFWLSELDRSLDLANASIKKFKPDKLIIGKIIDYRGSSVQDGTLLPLAFYLLARSLKIPFKFMANSHSQPTLRQMAGKAVDLIRHLSKTKMRGNYDLLFLAPPSKLALAKPLVENWAKTRISVCYLTYNLSLFYRRQINKLINNYFEKEKLMDKKIRMEVLEIKKGVLKRKDWQKFVHPKYVGNLVVTESIRKKIGRIVLEELGEILIDLALAKKILADVRPKVLLTLTDPDTKCLTFINAAKKLGIKTIAIQHGADFDQIPYSIPVSDYYLVWSDLAKRNMLSKLTTNTYQIYDRKKIFIAQSPFHKPIAKKMIGHKLPKISLLFLATIHGFEKRINNYYLKKLFSVLCDLRNEIDLTIRLHPYQNMADFKALVENYSLSARFGNEDSLDDVVSRNDVVIFENTTAGLSALLAGKPTIFFNPYTGRDFFDLAGRGASVSILRESEIYDKLLPFFMRQDRWNEYAAAGWEFAKRYLGLDANRGESKIVTVIRGLVNSNQSETSR